MTTVLGTAQVADCVSSHVAWMSAQAALVPGGAWADGPLSWATSADGRTVHGLFPDHTPRDVLARGIHRAVASGAVEIGVWSAVDVQRPELLAAGSELGWQPQWMAASTSAFEPGAVALSRRAVLSVRARPHEASLQPLLARGDTWRGEARDGSRYAGRAWLHVTEEVGGLYDMAVWPRFRRAGHGRDLVTLLGATARAHGVASLTLNATPEGALLYAACGFTTVGHGRTWWWHRPGATGTSRPARPGR